MNETDKKDIVILALARWDGPISGTAFCLAEGLSKTNRVFYIDNPFTISDVIRGWGTEQIRKRIISLFFGMGPCRRFQDNENLFYVTSPLVIPINFLPKGRIYNFFSGINNFGISRTLKKVCKEKNIRDFVFLNSLNPFYFSNIQKFKPACTVYYNGDYMSESKYVSKHGVELEKKLIRQFTFTISTSRFLQKYSALFTSESHYLPNAADFYLFRSALSLTPDNRPDELKNVKSKIVGYIGHVEDRIDFDLLLDVINLNPDKCFLFIGPIGSDQFRNMGFELLPNVVALGSKNIKELPNYLRFIDCAIIPYKKNKLTEGIYPLKINEYLAAGRPVVCTSFSQDILEFNDVIQLADSAAEFSKAIQAEIDSDNPEKIQNRLNKATVNTWESRANEFKRLISKYS